MKHDGSERRKHHRKPIRHPARILLRREGLHGRLEEHGDWHDCLIENIAPGGTKVLLHAVLAVGEAVHLEIGKFGVFGAIVAWIASGEFGLRFTEPPEKMSEVVMALAVYG